MRIADTSAIFAAFAPNDAHHDEARRWLSSPEPITIPAEIFSEALTLIQLRQGYEWAREVGAALRRKRHIRIVSSKSTLVDAAWNEYAAAEGELSLPDAFVVAWVEAEQAGVLTFDRQIQKRLART